MNRLSLVVALLLLSVAASAQVMGPVVFAPAEPTERDRILVKFRVSTTCGVSGRATVIDGTTVRTTIALGGCFFGPPPATLANDAAFGPLPAGTYTHELYYTLEGSPPEFVDSQPLVVSAVPIPTLPPLSLLALSLALATVATIAIVRR